MDDTVSRSSQDSSSTGDEYVLVNADPKLKITGDIDDIHQEICMENTSGSASRGKLRSIMTDSLIEKIEHVIPSSQSVDVLSSQASSEKQEHMSASLPSSPTGDCIVFNGVTYLGCATVNAPRSEVEIYRNMAVLNEQSQSAIPIVLAVPSASDGTVSGQTEGIVRLLDPDSDTEISSYKIHRILFCARGPVDSSERRCFAFTFSHGDSAETTIFQCHVFRCDIPEAVAKILYCFANTFRRLPKHIRSTSSASFTDMDQHFVFVVNLDFQEEDGKGGYSSCPRDKDVFKLRCELEKRIAINVQQTGSQELKIERCFGLLVSPGRNVKHGDMHLIEMSSMGYSDGEMNVYSISGHWDPTERCFEVLNSETPRDTCVFLTVAIDLVIHGIQEPVRFAIETKARIFPQTERFWYFTKKPHADNFHVKLKQVERESGEVINEVVFVTSQTEMDRKKAGLSLSLGQSRYIPDNIQTPQEGPDEESDGDEPLLSGSGTVSKEITDENILEAWHEVLKRWHQNLSQKPRHVHQLARKGIPEALRGEVWQLLAGCHHNPEHLEAYRVLITKDSPCEQVIQRDINRTFPAHDFFKEAGGLGQDSLYKISKAYSVYDAEIGYCQGQSFLAAALLLHMPEEQAFSVLVKIMFDYGLRDVFKNDFDVLHMKFFQLERLLQDQLPDLFEHFMEMNVEAHMYASQWFLTLFTAKFPLFMVFNILDIFLSDGKDVIFSVALALLKLCRKDLLAMDFEGVLKYFRVQLPKRFRTEEATRELMQTIISTKISSKKLKKYEKEYQAVKEQEMQQEDPIERLENENKQLKSEIMRRDYENDYMGHKMVESELRLKQQLTATLTTSNAMREELTTCKKILKEAEEEKARLEAESHQLKEMCRNQVERLETDNTKNRAIISDYKQISTHLSEQLEQQKRANRKELQAIRSQIEGCSTCSQIFSAEGNVQVSRKDESTTEPPMSDMEKQVRDLELELAQTKLALVESQCKTQDLTHQLNSALTEIQASKNTWFTKTINSIKDVTNTSKKDSKVAKE